MQSERSGPGHSGIPLAEPEPSTLAQDLSRLIGYPVAAPALRWRWWRWIAELPGRLLLFVAPDESAWARLDAEAQFIQRLQSHLDVSVPSVVASCPDARCQIRRMVDGVSGVDVERVVFGSKELPSSTERYSSKCPITEEGRRLAKDLGLTIAQLHGALGPEEAKKVGLSAKKTEATFSRIRDVLLRNGLEELSDAVNELERWYAGLGGDAVVCHGDLHLHNLAIDGDTGRLIGIFDFDEVCVDHAMSDLRYLHSNGAAFAQMAAASYEMASGRSTDLRTIERFHLLSAFRHFVYVKPDADRFPHIVEWARAAQRAFGFTQ